MSASPRIAVVIPCRNDADYLDACLQALANQTRPADLVLVVDNASTDATAATAHAHAARCVREDRIGIWPAAARGYDEVSGVADVIARLDADCRPDPDWLARVEAAFRADVGLDVLTGGARFYDAGPVLGALGTHAYIGAGHFWVRLWLGRPFVFGSNFAMRSSVWQRVRDRVHRDNARIHDDLDLTIHLGPDVRVRYDRTLMMPVSARPLRTPRALGTRVWRVVPTFAASWPEGAPRRRHRR